MLRKDMEDNKDVNQPSKNEKMYEMKYTLDGINSRIDTEKISVTEIKNVLLFKMKGCKGSKSVNRELVIYLSNFKLPNTHAIGVPGEKRKDGTEKMFK